MSFTSSGPAMSVPFVVTERCIQVGCRPRAVRHTRFHLLHIWSLAFTRMKTTFSSTALISPACSPRSGCADLPPALPVRLGAVALGRQHAAVRRLADQAVRIGPQ